MTWREKWEDFKESIRHMGKHEEEYRHAQETKVKDPHHPDDVAGSEFLSDLEGKKTNAPEASGEERR